MSINKGNISIRIQGGGLIQDTSGINPATERATIGSSNLDSWDTTLTFGTGDNQMNVWYLGERTVTATTHDDLDLTALANKIGAVNLAKVRFICIQIDTPDGTKSLRVGPQGLSNAWQGPFGGVAAANYLTVLGRMFIEALFGNGLGAVGGTTKVLGIYNPGATSVTYQAWVVGIQ